MATKNITYKLLSPVEVEGKERTEITLRPPKVKDAQAIEKAEGVEQTVILISRLSEWPEEAISELAMIDMIKIGKILEGFMKRLGI
ncbi:phage tail assembly protein [Bartonella schoenbuchensis]|uniref:Putative phage related protein n=1 Tax=Bartonella schoenbuchensis m07a TaxID=1094496 RepID=N6VBC3_9HYPH|nr:phage tail assembly protein [Bartonella schoenbuchensis]ENN90829.1 putative phage related protein [Bartonella schoenbuchensis m07a]ENN91090.1 putative phage related protein [Bartonella schoenbuchensis m07a]